VPWRVALGSTGLLVVGIRSTADHARIRFCHLLRRGERRSQGHADGLVDQMGFLTADKVCFFPSVLLPIRASSHQEHYRAVIVLHDVDALSMAEVADCLDGADRKDACAPGARPLLRHRHRKVMSGVPSRAEMALRGKRFRPRRRIRRTP